MIRNETHATASGGTAGLSSPQGTSVASLPSSDANPAARRDSLDSLLSDADKDQLAAGVLTDDARELLRVVDQDEVRASFREALLSDYLLPLFGEELPSDDIVFLLTDTGKPRLETYRAGDARQL